MRIPRDVAAPKFADWAMEQISICKVSQAQRASAYRSYSQWVETGKANGGLGTANLLSAHLERLQSHIFSPTDLTFTMDFENHYDMTRLKQAEVAARTLTREWERRNIDTTFAKGVKESLKYGASIPKLLLHPVVADEGPQYSMSCRLVAPWNFGVYNESENELDDQEAVCETVYQSKSAVWRRIAHLPNAQDLYKRIISNSNKDQGAGSQPTAMHQVLSTAILPINLQNATTPQPGGIVQLSSDPNYATLGPTIGTDLIPMHELWAKDDNTGDYTTIQLIEPNIIVAPRMKYSNLFCPETLPYGLIQPNAVAGYFWGQSEIKDLMMLQNLFNDTLDDTQRLYKAQFDKILGFVGMEGLTDETYDQMRAGGYVGLPQGADIKDVTPKLPEQCLAYIQLIEQIFDRVAGFPNILAGQGEKGVRAGNHADTLLRTASPRLRNMALNVERQAATFADKSFAAMQAKDARVWWIGDKSEEGTDFLLEQIPDDRRVCVDSHSSSPIYMEDHQQLIAFGLKSEIVGPEYAIDHLPFPEKDKAKNELRQREEQKQALVAKLIQADPQHAAEILTGKKVGGKKSA